MSDTKIVQIKLDEKDSAYVEVRGSEIYEEMGPGRKIYETASDYVKVASSIINNLKEMKEQPSSIELEFGITLAMTSGGILSWVATETSANASIGIKMTWEKETILK